MVLAMAHQWPNNGVLRIALSTCCHKVVDGGLRPTKSMLKLKGANEAPSLRDFADRLLKPIAAGRIVAVEERLW
jgi:hypothetical protein